MASDVELAARAGHLPHPHVPGHDGAVTVLPASLARARFDVGVDVLEVLEHVRLPRQERLGLDAASEVLLERRVHGELEHRVDVHNDHLVPGDARRVGEHTLPGIAGHLVHGEHDGDDVLRERLAVRLGVAGHEGAVRVDELGHAQHTIARVDAGRARRRAVAGAAAQIEHRRPGSNQCVRPLSHVHTVVREAIDEVRDEWSYERVEPAAKSDVAKPVDSLIEPIRRASWAQGRR
mmetsp:Transcript_36609/g.92798  ORF Transcript_36609/g.92798 Transcript_36609/m.92798 type:complete len:235 (+) Transcript_36609:298-1002(+)